MLLSQSFRALVLSFCFFAILAIRFFNITNIGLSTPDGFYYWQMALDWMNGLIPESEHFRPFIYWLQSKLFLIFGPSDWILRLFNGICDSGVGLLLIYLTWLMRKNLELALTVAISYFSLFLPLFESARADTIHAPSSFFLMTSAIFLIRWCRNLKPLELLLHGIFMSMAWHIHPDLAVLGAASAFILFIKLILSNRMSSGDFWKKGIINFSIFLIGYWSLFLVFAFKLGLNEMISTLLVNQKTQGKVAGTFIARLFNTSFTYIFENLGYFFTPLLLIAVAILFYKIIKKRVTSHDLVLVIFPFTYLFFCALLFSRFSIARIFIPLVPILCAFILIQIYDVLKSKKNLLLIGVVTLGLLINYKTLVLPFEQPISEYKTVHKEFINTIKDDEKYLITPLSTFYIHSPLRKPVYLNGQGIYLTFTKEESLSEVVEKNHIRYVWIAEILHDPKVFEEYKKRSDSERLKTLFNMDLDKYSRDEEISKMKAFLNQIEAKLIYKTKIGELYELK